MLGISLKETLAWMVYRGFVFALAAIENRAVGNGIYFCDPTRRASQKLPPPPHKEGIPFHRRGGDKPLDTTLIGDDNMSALYGNEPRVSLKGSQIG